jgi:hypothetical protein
MADGDVNYDHPSDAGQKHQFQQMIQYLVKHEFFLEQSFDQISSSFELIFDHQGYLQVDENYLNFHSGIPLT